MPDIKRRLGVLREKSIEAVDIARVPLVANLEPRVEDRTSNGAKWSLESMKEHSALEDRWKEVTEKLDQLARS